LSSSISSSSSSSSSSSIATFGAAPIIPFIPFGFGGGFGSPRSRRVKTKAKYGYTPDYTSIVMGRKGKATKGSYGGKYSGFEVRPVTEGWAKSIGGTFGVFGKKKKKKKKR